MRAERLIDAPIISPRSHPSIGTNIQGPSLVRVPEWVEDRLGTFYLYFADHKGDHIRLAFADALVGPWTVRPGGVLSLARSGFLTEPPAATEAELVAIEKLYLDAMGGTAPAEGIRADITTPHIASPDVTIDKRNRVFSMYFHGLESLGIQATRHAVSADGLSFAVDPVVIDGVYLRRFRHGGVDYGLTMPGRILRRGAGPTVFEAGPSVLPDEARHAALLVVDDELQIFWTRVGDAPERILCSRVDLSLSWTRWHSTKPVEVLRPEREWEGAYEAVEPSRRGAAEGFVNQLRDPHVFGEAGSTFMVYAIGGERGLGIAELFD